MQGSRSAPADSVSLILRPLVHNSKRKLLVMVLDNLIFMFRHRVMLLQGQIKSKNRQQLIIKCLRPFDIRNGYMDVVNFRLHFSFPLHLYLLKFYTLPSPLSNKDLILNRQLYSQLCITVRNRQKAL